MMTSKIEQLSDKFNSLLTQYIQTYSEFINTINLNSSNETLKTIHNSAVINGNNINTIQNSTLDDCSKLCSADNLCSGATFDNNLNTCNLNSGTLDVINSRNQTAIIKQALYYSYQLKKINNELTNINNSMMNLANSNIDTYKQTQISNSEKAKILENNYNTLNQERQEIDKIINEYETLNSAYENGDINLTYNYYNYIIYIFIAIFLFILLFKISLSSEQVGGSNVKFSNISFYISILAIVIIIINLFY